MKNPRDAAEVMAELDMLMIYHRITQACCMAVISSHAQARIESAKAKAAAEHADRMAKHYAEQFSAK